MRFRNKPRCPAKASPGNVETASDPTPNCLVARLPQMRAFLARRAKFSNLVIDQAIDRVVQAALPHLKPGGCSLNTAAERARWLFCSVLMAARQLAAKEIPYTHVEPSTLANFARRDDLSKEEESAVHAALEQLTERQRCAAYYCDMCGWTFAEAAAEMGCKSRTVVFHRDAARRRLAAILPKLLPGRFRLM